MIAGGIGVNKHKKHVESSRRPDRGQVRLVRVHAGSENRFTWAKSGVTAVIKLTVQ